MTPSIYFIETLHRIYVIDFKSIGLYSAIIILYNFNERNG